MKTYLFVLFCPILFASCRQSIKPGNVKIKDGLYIDSPSGEMLNGKYRSVTPPEQAMEKEHISTFGYTNGVPSGEWTYSYGGDLIHHGEYLDHDILKTHIQSLTNCLRVDVNLWKEGDKQFLTLELIQPTATDTLTLQKVTEAAKTSLSEGQPFKEIIIDLIGPTERNCIYRHGIK